jgi:exopolysaccharide/PEP-CTERM locus tyrosine autokinase
LGKIYKALEKFKAESAPDQLHEAPADHSATSDGSAEIKTVEAVHESLPKDSRSLDRNLIAFHSPLSHAAEQFKILRTRLLFPPDGIPPRVIMVTSAMQGEGKSFSAANLAVSIAQGINEHVLLIDCDMRRPVQNQIFGFGRVNGLSDYLSKKKDLEDILLKTSIEKLTLLPGGRIPPNPAELLSSKRMSELLQEVKERYQDRFVVIDTPPPHLTAETNALAKQVDCILLVMQHHKTSREQVETLVEKLGKEKILGIILNQFKKTLKKYNNYYYYQEKDGKS